MNPGETIAECAVREVFEETGIQLDIDSLGRSIVVKSKAMYYLTDMAECDVQLQTEMHDNDANGIGWFHLDCLHEMVQSGEIAINNPCRILIRKVFGREIPFNQDDQNFVVVRRSPTRNHRGTQKEKND
jgi:8-oxo-dGTP pyrophosphatase MutT (NUDIX family)